MKQRAGWKWRTGRPQRSVGLQWGSGLHLLGVLSAAAALGCGSSSEGPEPVASGALSAVGGAAAPGGTTPDGSTNSASGGMSAGAGVPSAMEGVTPGELAPGAGGAAPGVGPGVLPAAASALADALTASVAGGDVPGVVALVVGPEGVLFEGAAGELSDGTPMPVNAIFNIASMTKPVTSVAVMMLIDEDQLELDDAVSQFLPGFDALEVLTGFDAAGAAQTAPAQTTMTVRHLLAHTSGIGYAFANSTVGRLQQANPGQPEWELPLLNEPGARWNYSASTRVLGLIVEQLSGQPLNAFFQERIFVPLGMVDTSYAVPADQRSRVPALHTRSAGGALSEAPQSNIPAVASPPFNGDGGLYSTAQDYGRFMRMLLNDGQLDGVRILSEESVALMGQNQLGESFVEQQEAAIPQLTRPFPLGAGSDKFGLGFQLTGEAPVAGQRRTGSMAWAGLFNTEFWIDPQAQLAATHLVQVLPFYDEGALRALSGFETAVYGALAP